MIEYGFHAPGGWTKNIDDKFQITIVTGNIGDKIHRELKEDVINADNLTYDGENTNIIKRENKISVIKGQIQKTIYWNNDDITEADIDRIKVLNKNDKIRKGTFTENSTLGAITNKKYIITYSFNSDYDVIAPNSMQWVLHSSHILEALKDDTRLFCLVSEDNDFNINIIDIPVGETKTINKNYNNDTDKYIFFSQNCSVGDTQINQYDCKKLTTDTINVKNESNEILRIFLISR